MPVSRSLGDIVRANVLTPFNAVLGSLWVVTLVIGPPQDALFGLILVLNSAVGIVQELRAKVALDRLTLLVGPPPDLHPGDVFAVGRGDQLPADGRVTEGAAELDESLVTGESEPVAKGPGDEVLSGTFVTAGSLRFRVERAGGDAYAERLAAEARHFQLARSELRRGVGRFIKGVGYALPVLAVLLVWSQAQSQPDLKGVLRGSIAGLVTLVPEGLVLLTSLTLSLAAIRLARRQVLTQDLAAVEVLARVDTVCTDKTGTLTERAPELAAVEVLGEDGAEVRAGLGALAALESSSGPSAAAIAKAVPDPGWQVEARTPFSSSAGWSEAEFAGHGRWWLGAPERLGGGIPRAAELAAAGHRVLLLCHDGRPAALAVLRERVRQDAPNALAYFREQGVDVRVLSGDSSLTVAAVARDVGLDPARAQGRMTPDAKREEVLRLRREGHVVAMIGDGVNDIPAMKAADVGIAVAGGSGAARAVAQLVLADAGFAALPGAVTEGRRVIANTERLSSLYFAKSVYAALIVLAVGVAGDPFPFFARQLTLVAALTIGIPSFFLAFSRGAPRARPGFLGRSLRLAVPGGLVLGGATYAAYALVLDEPGVTRAAASTVATLVLIALGLWFLAILLRPITRTGGALLGSLAVAGVAVMVAGPARGFFALAVPAPLVLLAGLGVVTLSTVGLELVRATSRLSPRS